AAIPRRGGGSHSQRTVRRSGRGGIRSRRACVQRARTWTGRAPSGTRAHGSVRRARLPEKARPAEIPGGSREPQLPVLLVRELPQRLALQAKWRRANGTGVGKPAKQQQRNTAQRRRRRTGGDLRANVSRVQGAAAETAGTCSSGLGARRVLDVRSLSKPKVPVAEGAQLHRFPRRTLPPRAVLGPRRQVETRSPSAAVSTPPTAASASK